MGVGLGETHCWPRETQRHSGFPKNIVMMPFWEIFCGPMRQKLKCFGIFFSPVACGVKSLHLKNTVFKVMVYSGLSNLKISLFWNVYSTYKKHAKRLRLLLSHNVTIPDDIPDKMIISHFLYYIMSHDSQNQSVSSAASRLCLQQCGWSVGDVACFRPVLLHPPHITQQSHMLGWPL